MHILQASVAVVEKKQYTQCELFATWDTRQFMKCKKKSKRRATEKTEEKEEGRKKMKWKVSGKEGRRRSEWKICVYFLCKM